jgi:hypothetical protein
VLGEVGWVESAFQIGFIELVNQFTHI